MHRYTIWLIAVFSLFSFTSIAQIAPVFQLTYNGTQPSINQLYQSKSGYILVATTNGLFKFDGIGFHRYSQQQQVPNNITAICELSNGTIWLGYENGNLALLHNNTIVLQTPQEGFPKVAIKKIIQDKHGKVWMATAGEGIYYFNNQRFFNLNTDDGLSDDYVYDLAVDEASIVACTDRGLNTISINNPKAKISTFTSAQGLKDNIVKCIVPKAKKEYWISMQEAGLGTYSHRNNVEFANSQINWPYQQVNAILSTQSKVYAGTEKHGIVVVDENHANNGWAITNTIPFNGKVSAMLADHQGNLWAAGNNQLVRFGNSHLNPLFPVQANDNLHALMVDSEGHIWYNDKQVLKHASINQHGIWETKTYSLPIAAQAAITALYEDRFGYVWIGTMGNGLLVLNPITGKFRKITEDKVLQNGSILSISGKGNAIWIASLEGAVQCQLTAANQNSNLSYRFTDYTAISGIGSNYIYAIYTDSRNRVWFATDGKGLSVWDGKTFTNYNTKNGLPDEVVYQIVEDSKGNIWCSTFKGGIIKFNGSTFQSITTKNGLSTSTIGAIAIDKFDNLYITHKNGIDILNTQTGQIVYLTTEHGVSNVQVDLNTLAADKMGNIFFVANQQLFNYTATAALLKPRVLIDKVQLFLNDTIVPSGHLFSYDENNLSFYFTGIDYTNTSNIQYQYTLTGYNGTWVSTKDRSVNFPKLNPGHYTFKVRASLNGSFEQTAEASFSFVILAPIWQQWWFIVLVLLLAVALIILLIKYREKRLQQLGRLEREKIQLQFETLRNQVNPHFLFNSFNTLIAEIEENPEQAVVYVEHLSDFYRSIVVYREKDVIPLQEELDLMKDYYFIQQKRYGSAFTVDVDIATPAINAYQIAPLTLQLLIENAVKHNAVSVETPLRVNISLVDGWLIIYNKRNPKIKPEISSGMGLQHIQKRYQLLTQKTIIIEKTDTYFKVSIPLIATAK